MLRETGLKPVDHTALRTNQAVIISLNLAAYILDSIELVGLVAAVMLLGTLAGTPGFGFIYRKGLRPLDLFKPEIIEDNPEPHRFAQGFGSMVLLAGFFALINGWLMFGWALVWLVIALAALNLFAGFCIGCAVYYWLERINFPGFSKQPPPGVIPGRPPAGDSE